MKTHQSFILFICLKMLKSNREIANETNGILIHVNYNMGIIHRIIKINTKFYCQKKLLKKLTNIFIF